MKSHETDRGYVISVAARRLGLHVNTLRKYERQGLIAPSRSPGNSRLFSSDDLIRLEQIKRLVDERGVNVAGITVALELTDHLLALRQAVDDSQTISPQLLSRAIDQMLVSLRAVPADDLVVRSLTEDVDESERSSPPR